MDQEIACSDAVRTFKPTFSVDLDLSAFKPIQCQLITAWLEIWLKLHCHSPWTMVQHHALSSKDRSTVSLVFEDGSEAMLFKLSPEYLLCQKNLLGGRLAYSAFLY